MAEKHPEHKVKIEKCELCNQEIPIQLTEHHLKKHTLDSSDDSEPPQKRQKISFKGSRVKINYRVFIHITQLINFKD